MKAESTELNAESQEPRFKAKVKSKKWVFWVLSQLEDIKLKA